MRKNQEKNPTICRCGSGLSGVSCCLPLLSGEQLAGTAEQLMRSRFVAYATANKAYLQHTWHSSTRPASLSLDEQLRWIKLEIIQGSDAAAASSLDEDWVEFVATYIHLQSGGQSIAGQMHERSRFVREAGEWRYIDGVQYATDEVNLKNIGRNDPCFCGSGKKFKKCCALQI